MYMETNGQPQASEPTRTAKGRYRARIGIAVAIALFFTIPNLSAEAACVMGNLPLIGQLVQVVTCRRYVYHTDAQHVDIRIPQIRQAGEAGEQINAAVKAEADRLLRAFEAELGTHVGLDIQYQVVRDDALWFTMRVDIEQTGASGAQRVQYYHIDKKKGEMVTLSSVLPWKGDYIRVLSDEVRNQMQQRNAADSSAAYFPQDFDQIDPEQAFYWDENGKLVLVFDEYTLAAGSMGISEFVIAPEIIQSLIA